MSVFIRRFLFDPGQTVLLNIESVNILDLEPPASISGIGSGTVLLVGEFEDGAFATPSEVVGSTDLQQTWGTLGYTYNGTVGNYPCAVSRKADGALVAEYWNGNAFVQLSGKQFARLLVCRVDTSVGSVQFSRLAFVEGASSFRYSLVTGQILSVDVGAGFTSATFTGTVATVTSGAGTYPTTFVGGNTLTLGYDGAPNFTVTFLAADQTIDQVVARINTYAGFTFAVKQSSTTFSLTGLQGGTGGQVRVVSGSTGVLAQLGLVAATTIGSGNVANIAAVSPAEIALVVQAAVANTKVEQNSSGALRISNTGTSGFISIGAGTTASALGFVSGQFATSYGQAVLQSGTCTFASMLNNQTLTLSIDGVQFTTTFVVPGDTTQSAVLSRINAAAAAAGLGTVAVADSATAFYLTGTKPGGSVVVVGASAGAVLTNLGLTVGTTTGVLPPQGVLPAGTVVQQPNGIIFVTMQSITIAGGLATLPGQTLPQPTLGPYTVKIRHAVDDGTGLSAGAGSITQVTNAPDIGSFSVVNPQITTVALTEAQIDAQYTSALIATTDINTVAKQANIVFSARQSNTVRKQLRVNALNASSQGCFGRMACIRPPLGTAKALALSTVAEPGVGAYRDQRVIYCYPGFNTFVPLIAKRGTSGGTGFNASGNIDVGSDGFMASILSQLPPEENPGQETTFTAAVNSLEMAVVQGGTIGVFQMADYQLFKAAGIAAGRMDDGVAIFQSGVTSVDPNVNPGLVRISRRRMADYIQDSVAIRAKAFGKRLSTVARRLALAAEIRAFMLTLLSPGNPAFQRINGFTVDPKKANTPQTLALGMYRIILNVQTIPSLDSIVLQTTVGEQVSVNEVLPTAA